jgi:hypothetical protein
MRHPTKPLPLKDLRRKGDGVTAFPIAAGNRPGEKNTHPGPRHALRIIFPILHASGIYRHPVTLKKKTPIFIGSKGVTVGVTIGVTVRVTVTLLDIRPDPPTAIPTVEAPVAKQGFAPSRWRAVFTFPAWQLKAGSCSGQPGRRRSRSMTRAADGPRCGTVADVGCETGSWSGFAIRSPAVTDDRGADDAPRPPVPTRSRMRGAMPGVMMIAVELLDALVVEPVA